MVAESLGYVRIGMRAPQLWAEVGESVLGFESKVLTDGSVILKMDDAPFRYLIESSDQDGFIAAGWQFSEQGYGEIVDRFAGSAIEHHQGSGEECEKRQVAAFIRASDPSGNVFEVYHGRSGASPFTAPLGINYVAGDLGLGHVVLPAPEHDATCEFYQSQVGFSASDELTLPPPADGFPEMKIHFYHAANPRHHSLALFNGPAPSGVVHLMTEMRSIDEVGACLDRVNHAGLPVTASMGRHVNDGMLSFYFLAPGGIPMEVGCDGLQFDWSEFTPTQSTVGDYWGHVYNFPE